MVYAEIIVDGKVGYLNPNYALENLLCSEIIAKPIAALYFLI